MSGRSLLWAAVLAFIIFGLVRVFKPDYSDPDAVMRRYLEHWRANNTSGMYPLLSTAAKQKLREQNVNNLADYYSSITTSRFDLTGYEIVTHEVGESIGRYWVQLRTTDILGRGIQSDATFFLVREEDGWRVDSWQQAGRLHTP